VNCLNLPSEIDFLCSCH